MMDSNGDDSAAQTNVDQELQTNPGPPPKAPNPSADPGVLPRFDALNLNDDTGLPEGDFDVMQLDSVIALKILSRGVQTLTDMTGDIPATPPIQRPGTPTMRQVMNEFKPRSRTPSRPATPVPSDDLKPSAGFHREQIGAPEAHFSEPHVIEDEPAYSRAQYETIARKFFSKRPPPIAITDYLLRLHKYCPMSTAVYLAGGCYIHKLAVIDKVVPVTPRTVHRLLLASLRVAMKALEDLSYPHQRFAGVGGVTEKELAKLEISLCYLMDFELRTTNQLLHDNARAFQQLASVKNRLSANALTLTMPRRGRSQSSLVA